MYCRRQNFVMSWCLQSLETLLFVQQFLQAKKKLEQLEHLRSENTPRRPMITHTINSYQIPCHGRVPEMFVTSYSVTYCIYIPGKLGFYYHHYCAVYDECKQLDTLWPADRIRLFVHYTISLSSLCKLICRHWTYEMFARYIFLSVWVRLSMFS